MKLEDMITYYYALNNNMITVINTPSNLDILEKLQELKELRKMAKMLSISLTDSTQAALKLYWTDTLKELGKYQSEETAELNADAEKVYQQYLADQYKINQASGVGITNVTAQSRLNRTEGAGTARESNI